MNSENIDKLTLLQLLNVRTDSKLIPIMSAKISTNAMIFHAKPQLVVGIMTADLNASV